MGSATPTPISPNFYSFWGSAAAASSGGYPNVVDSGTLDALFSNSSSVTVPKILIDPYSSASSSLYNPGPQSTCATNQIFSIENIGISYLILQLGAVP